MNRVALVCGKPIRWAQSETACRPACRAILLRESYRVIRAREQSRQRFLPADLSLEAWAANCRVWKWACAYCGGPFETMDHVTPQSAGGGTTQANVLPCCERCNGVKGHQRLTNVTTFAPERVQQILTYLSTLHHE